MYAETGPTTERKKRSRKKVLALVLAAAVILILLVVFVIPAFVSSESGRNMILAKINDSVEGRADFGDLSMSWWKGVRITEVSFTDNEGRILARIKQIVTKPHYGALLLGRLSFGATKLVEPAVEINLTEQGAQGGGGSGGSLRAGEAAEPVALPLKRIDLTVTNGSLKLNADGGRSVEFLDIKSRLNLRPPGKRTQFEADMAVRQAKVHTDGWIEPDKRRGWTVKGFNGEFFAKADGLSLDSVWPVFELAGVAAEAEGRVSASIRSRIGKGRIETLRGSITGQDVDVRGDLLKGDRLKTGVLNVSFNLNREKERINIGELLVDSDWLDAEANGVVPTTYESLAEFVRADSAYTLNGSLNCRLSEAFSQMPRMLGVKEGVKITSGDLTSSIKTVIQRGAKQISAKGDLSELAGTFEEEKVALSAPVTARLEMTSDKAGTKYDRVDVSASFAKIRCTGTSELVQYEAEADLGKLHSEVGQLIGMGRFEMAGELVGRGEVSGSKERISAVGSSSIKGLRLSSGEGAGAFEPEANIDFSVVIQPKENILGMSSVSAKAGLGEFSIHDSVLPLGEKATEGAKLAVSANDVDLGKLQPFAVLLASFPKDIELEGVARSNLTVSSEKGRYRILTDATDITNLRFRTSREGEALEQKEVWLAADVEISPAERGFEVRKLQLTSPQLKVHECRMSQVSKEGTSLLRGELDCEYDWAGISVLAAGHLPPGLKLEGKRRDTVGFSSEYPAGGTNQVMANLSTRAKLGFKRAEYMGLNIGATEADIEVRNGVLEIKPFSTTVNNGELTFAARADFTKKPWFLELTKPMQVANNVEVNARITKKLLPHLNPLFSDAVVVAGTADFHCERLAIPLAGAPKEKLQIIGTISADNLRLSESSLLSELLTVGGLSLKRAIIRMRPTRFILWDGFLRYDDMQIDVGDNPFNFKAAIGLDDSLNMTVALPYTYDGRTVRVDETTTAERITVPIGGTVHEPEVDMGEMLQDQLKKRLEGELRDKIREGLEKLFE